MMTTLLSGEINIEVLSSGAHSAISPRRETLATAELMSATTGSKMRSTAFERKVGNVFPSSLKNRFLVLKALQRVLDERKLTNVFRMRSLFFSFLSSTVRKLPKFELRNFVTIAHIPHALSGACMNVPPPLICIKAG